VARIALLAFNLWESPGGIQRYGTSLASALCELDDSTLEVIAVGASEVPPSGARNGLLWIGSRSRILRILKALWFALWVMPRSRYDVVIVLHARLLAITTLWNLLRTTPRRLILVEHGVEVWRSPSFFEKINQRHINTAVAVSAHTEERALSSWWRGVPRQCRIISGTVAADRKLVPDLSLGEPDPVKTIVSVARLSREDSYKGIDLTLAAMRLVCERESVRYVVYGDGDDRERLEQLVHAYALSDVVEFRGWASDEEIISTLKKAACFALPSSGEGLGLASLEALSCGCPVVVGDSDGARELLVSPACGMAVAVGDAVPLANALCGVINWSMDPTQRVKRSAAVLEFFGFERFKARWREVLENTE
jgi:phosphatidyl-myo-inositol dimannoside synthase